MIYKIDTKFNFGKYKGYTVAEILKKDADYIGWAVENNVIELDEEAEAELDTALYEAIDWD